MPWWNLFSKKPAVTPKPELQPPQHRSVPVAKPQQQSQSRNEAVKQIEKPSEPKTVKQTVDAAIHSLIGIHQLSSNSAHKSQAAKATCEPLEKIGAPAVGPLLQALSHSDSEVRSCAIRALGFIGHSGCHAYDNPSQVAREMRRIGASAVEPLLGALNHPDVEVRLCAVRTLGLIADARVVEGLIRALDDDGEANYSKVRHEAVWALGWTHDRRAVEPLMAALNNSQRFYASNIVKVLGEIGDPRAVETLIALLPMDEAAEALGNIGDARAVEPLIRVISRVKYGKAAEALGKIGDTRAVEPLIGLLNDKDAGWQVAEALAKIGDVRAIKPLQEAVKAAKTTNYSAAKALLRFGDTTGIESLIEGIVTASNQSFVKETREMILDYGLKNRSEFVSFMLGLLQSSKNAGVRRYAAEFLVRLDESSVKTLLPPLLLDWLEFSSGRRTDADEGVKLIANAVGMDAELLKLATTALGYSVNTKSGSSSGGNFSWSSLDSYDGGMSAVAKLCQRQDAWSSCILHRVSKRKDASVTMTTCAPSSYEVKLSFEKEREAARQELLRRGLGDTDPITLLQT